MAKGIPINHLEFINAVAKGETQETAYTTTIGNNNTTTSTARAQASKLAKRYALQIQEAKENISKVITQANESKVAQKALKEILSVAEVDSILCESIINPESEVGKLMAIDKYYKRFGHNAPLKQAQTNVDGEDVPTTFVFNHNGVDPVKE